MSRPYRTAVLAALIALCAAVPALASLDPARMFDPGSESFLRLTPAPVHAISFVGASIFDENLALAELMLPLPEGRGAAPVIVGYGTVNLALPQMRATFQPSAGEPLAYAPPAIPREQPAVATPQALVAHVQVRTPAPVLTVPQAEAPHFGSYTPYTPALTGESEGAAMPVRLGAVKFETAFAAMQHCGTADTAAACAQGLSAGTAFNVRAGTRNLNLRLESGVTHTTNETAGVFPYVPLDPDAQAGLTYPGVSDVVGQNVGAGLAVPVTRRITVGLQFDRTHYQGNSATGILPGFEGMRDTYLTNLTYQLPNSSAITFSARQYRYQDLLTPNLNATQMRADVNFTVKF